MLNLISLLNCQLFFVNDWWFVFRNSPCLISHSVDSEMLRTMFSGAAGKRRIITSAVHKQHGFSIYNVNETLFNKCFYIGAGIHVHVYGKN